MHVFILADCTGRNTTKLKNKRVLVVFLSSLNCRVTRPPPPTLFSKASTSKHVFIQKRSELN